MEFVLQNWYLFAAAIASGRPAAEADAAAGAAAAAGSSAAEAVQLINREKAVLIDVSEPDEYAAAMPSARRTRRWPRSRRSRELPKNKALPLVVVCPTGAARRAPSRVLKKLGYENARVLAGGLAAWRAANLPVEKSAA